MAHQNGNIKFRKILGNGCAFSGQHSELKTSNATLSQDSNQKQQKYPSHFIVNSEGSEYNNSKNNLCNAAPVLNSSTPLNQNHQVMDHIRLPIMSQEMHALWPFGTTTFLSPMIPANVAVPYAAIAAGPYAATTVPFFQGTQQCNIGSPLSSFSSTSSSSAASQQIQMPQQDRSANSNGTSGNQNDSNKINIQIQCVSQNSPMNLNSIYDSATKLNLGKFCYSSCHKSEKDNKDSNGSLCNSPIPLHPDDCAAGGDAACLNFARSNGCQATANGVYLSQARFNDLRRLALRGSDIAENLAKTHRNRPCFKKIDSLCARLKQDLIRPDGVLPNINSQGIAWAVKDFIFVFTRIINAWIIIKGYVYNTPEGLNKVKAALSPDFALAFAAWQDTTMDFIESLIKSFVNLDNLVQSQKNAYQKSDAAAGGLNTSNSPIKLLSTTPNILLDDSLDQNNNYLNRNYIYTMVEDSEDSQRQATVNGTYFKTGTYNPIKKDELIAGEPIASLIVNNSNINADGLTLSASQLPTKNMTANETVVPFQNYFNNQIMECCPTSNGNYQLSDTPLTTMEFMKSKENNALNYDLHVLQQNLAGIQVQCHNVENKMRKNIGNVSKINAMKDRIMTMQNADMFFKFQFTKNYFPDFISKYQHEINDVRSIILKCEDDKNGYENVAELVNDVMRLINTGKEYMKTNNDEKFEKAINLFETEFNKLISDQKN
ncbi:protein mitoshell isoform X1 [Musca domestica]|uniref:Protein mitoshell isoform X1 n=1 Tax=Musca domestica TaxID=7370 RepID=A0A9J7ID94_MUSDO|nr:protein mitoshell isoform X1 [Musca domestica]